MFTKLTSIITKEKVKHSPFIIAGLIGLLDLSGGAISAIADIWWLAFDTMIKTDEFSQHYIAYGIVFVMLVLAAIILLTGAIMTIFVLIKFIKDGHLHKEIHTELEHKQQELLQKKRDKVFKMNKNVDSIKN